MTFWDTLPRPFFALAPMEAVTDVVFRQVVRQAGPPELFFTEFANATGWVHAGSKAIAGRLVRVASPQPLIAQIWGGEPGDMQQFAAHCAGLGFAGIDINMGCPAKSAIRSGGAALIRQPQLAVASIAAAKTAGLPVSVKTRLGYSRVDEWQPWLTALLSQDIANLTIHLRTKKEMSKVPAHYELISNIVALRDTIAPRTLLTINGDITGRAHGLQLVAQHPGVDGIMIGRGVFADPFCFRPVPPEPAKRQAELVSLLRYQLDLFDHWQPQLGRPYETLKRFYKIYLTGFAGAKELRSQLMATTSTAQARALLAAAGL